MKFITSVALLLSAASAAPSSLDARALTNDGDLLNYALTLEHLEAAFYKHGLNNYTADDFTGAGFDPTVYNNLKQAAKDESTHVKFLTNGLEALNVKPVKACTYDFGVSTPKEFLALANVLEGTGVSAYIGAAQKIADKALLTPAASILSVEARHTAFIRQTLGFFPFPNAFDTALSPKKVYTLASQFIKKCPKDSKIPLTPFPILKVVAQDTQIAAEMSGPGKTVTVAVGGKGNQKVPQTVHAAFITANGPVFVPTRASFNRKRLGIKVPEKLRGQNYLVLTSSPKLVNDKSIIAGPAVLQL